MTAALAQVAPTDVRAIFQDYFDAWGGTDENKILAFYPDNVTFHVPTGTLEGKAAVRDNFVRPFIAGFPGNVHAIQNLIHVGNLVAVEWIFEGVHSGTFSGIPATGKKARVPGCSFYEYDSDKRTISEGRIYFDLGTLMRQIAA